MEPEPDTVTDCNCSICRRYGALWAYTGLAMPGSSQRAELVQGIEALDAYVWGQREYRLNRCRHCGCVTHVSPADRPQAVFALNARMLSGFDASRVTLQRWDNAETGRFWTRPDAPIRKGMHPPMPEPVPEHWR
jgi:hypothetical protein